MRPKWACRGASVLSLMQTFLVSYLLRWYSIDLGEAKSRVNVLRLMVRQNGVTETLPLLRRKLFEFPSLLDRSKIRE